MAEADLRERARRVRDLRTSFARWAVWFNVLLAVLYVYLGSFGFLPRHMIACNIHVIYIYLSGIVVFNDSI